MPVRADVCASSHCTLELLLELALGAVSGIGTGAAGAAAGAGPGVAAVSEARQITGNGTQPSCDGRIIEILAAAPRSLVYPIKIIVHYWILKR